MNYIINKKFTTNTDITSRTLQIAEAFGLGIDEEKEFTIYNMLELEINQGDVMYVTGDSGSGKSILVKELRKHIDDCISIDDIEIDSTKSLVDSIGIDTNDALNYLALVGLSDAFLCLRKYDELSDGQKYRFKLAKMLESNKTTLIADEFCALLDRDTAKIIAYNFQKICRRLDITLIVATTHTDLLYDLNPNVYIYKKFEDEIELKYIPYEKREMSLTKDIVLEEGDITDYHKLEKFHYRGAKFVGHYKTYRMSYNGETIAVICYAYPPLALKGRNIVTDRYKKATTEVAKKINEEIKIITRVVTHPKYRGIGLASRLVSATMPLVNQRYVELLAVMGKYNPFAEKAGMTRIPYEEDDRYKKIQKLLTDNDFDLFMSNSTTYSVEQLKKIPKENRDKIAQETFKKVKAVFSAVSTGRGKAGVFAKHESADTISDLEIAQLIRECLPRERCYYIWENPNWVAKEEDEIVEPVAEDKPKKTRKKKETTEVITPTIDAVDEWIEEDKNTKIEITITETETDKTETLTEITEITIIPATEEEQENDILDIPVANPIEEEDDLASLKFF